MRITLETSKKGFNKKPLAAGPDEWRVENAQLYIGHTLRYLEEKSARVDGDVKYKRIGSDYPRSDSSRPKEECNREGEIHFRMER